MLSACSASHFKKLIRLQKLNSAVSLRFGCRRVNIASETKNINKGYHTMFAPRYRGFLIPFLLLLLHNKSSAATNTNTGEKDQRVPRVVLPIAYEIKLFPRIVEGNFTFHGESRIAVKVLEKTPNVTLHSNNLRIDENFTSLVDATGVTRTPKRHSYANATNFLIIEFDQPIPVGNYTLSLKYSGNGLAGMKNHSYVNHKGEEKVYFFTMIHTGSAGTVFPCWEDIDIRATFNLSIKHDSDLNAASKMPIRSKSRDTDGKVWTNFDVTQPIPAYSLHFFVSDFDCLRSENEKLSFCSRKEFLSHLKKPLEFTERALVIMRKSIDSKYMSPKLAQFVHPLMWRNPATLVYGERMFTAVPPLRTIEEIDETIAENLAVYMLRDSITISTLNSSWIINGLSSFLKYRAVDKLHPDWRKIDTFLILSAQRNRREYDKKIDSTPLSSDDRLSLFANTIRGAAVFHMLANALTERTFILGIRKFTKTAEDRSVTSDDLWSAMQSAYDENKEESDASLPIREIMRSWSDQIVYPIVNVTRDYKTGRVTITQSGVAPEYASNRYWIPINFATRSNPDFEKTTPSHWLKPEDESLIIDGIDKDDWIIVNIQLSGYYVVDYDETNWKRIAQYMNGENYQNIHVRNRASLLSDLYFMVWYRRQHLTTFLELASYLVREDDYLPWFPVYRNIFSLTSVSHGWEVDEQLKKFFLGLTDKVMQKIDFNEADSFLGPHHTKLNFTKTVNNNKPKKYRERFYEKKDFFTRRYRNIIKYLGCNLEHPSCLESITNQMRAMATYHFEIMPRPHYLYAFCDAVIPKSEEEFLKAMRNNSYDLQYLTHLACESDANALKNLVDKALAGELNLSDAQFKTALNNLISISENTANNTIDYIIKNFVAIFKHLDETRTAEESPGAAADLLRRCFHWTYTSEQTKELVDLMDKWASRLNNAPPFRIKLLQEAMVWRTQANRLREDEFPKMNEWFRDHSIHV